MFLERQHLPGGEPIEAVDGNLDDASGLVVDQRVVVGAQRGMDVDSADLIASDQQPVAATGQHLAL